MTSLRYFSDEKPEYNPYEPGNVNAFESPDSVDSSVERRVTLVNKFEGRGHRYSARLGSRSAFNRAGRANNDTHNRNHVGDSTSAKKPAKTASSPNQMFNELFEELDDDLLDSIDDYLYNSSLKRGSGKLIEDEFDGGALGHASGRPPSARPSNRASSAAIHPPANSDRSLNASGAPHSGIITNRTESGTSSGYTGRSWSTKFSNLGMNKHGSSSTEVDAKSNEVTHPNSADVVPYVDSSDVDFPNTHPNSNASMGEGWSGLEEVIELIDNTPPMLATGTASSNPSSAPDTNNQPSNSKNDQNVVPINGGPAFEDDIPIRKSKRRIIYDSQRYTSDSAIAKDDLEVIDDTLPIFDGGNGNGIIGATSAGGNAGASTVTATPTNKLTSSSSHAANASLSTRNGLNSVKTSGLRTLASSSFDSDSSEEEDFDECIICSESMKSELKNEIGVLDVCSHIFCFKCIKMWSDRANSCPLCKREFIHIRKVNLYNIQDLIEKYYFLASGAATTSDSPYISVGRPNSSLTNSANSFNRFNNASSFSISSANNNSGGETKSWRERRLRCIRKNKISKLKKIINEKINWFELIPSVKVKVERRRLQDEEEEGCTICGNDDNWAQLLLCDSCDKGYHIYCLDPPLTRVPDSNWYCAQCVSMGSSARLVSGATGRSARALSGTQRMDRIGIDMGPGVVASLTCARAGSSGLSGDENLFNIESLPASAIVNRTALRFVGENVISISSGSRLSSSRAPSLGTERPSSRRLRSSGASGLGDRADATSLTSADSLNSLVVTDSEEEQMRTSLLSQVYSSLNRRSPNATSRAISSLRSATAKRSRSSKAKRSKRSDGKRRKKASKKKSSSSSSSRRSSSSRGQQKSSPKSTSSAKRPKDSPKSAKKEQLAGQSSVSSTSSSSGLGASGGTASSSSRRDLSIKNIDQLIQESLESIDNYLLLNTTRPLGTTPSVSSTSIAPPAASAQPALSTPNASANKTKSVHFLPSLTTKEPDHSDYTASYSSSSSASNPSQASSSSYSSDASGSTASSGKDKKYTSFVYRYRTLTSENSSNLNKQEPYINGKTVKYLF